MVGGRCADRHGELRAATRFQLIGVQLEPEPGLLRRVEDSPGFVERKNTRLAKNVGEARDSLVPDGGQLFIDEMSDELAPAIIAAAEFVRNLVRAQPRTYD